ncbi:MAG TPA: HD domain-containing protein [candidate division WOR-3 bacterium]|uniref:HD domain-containing protein n=1 Tax=candidate division WOR-3 bacterium TaxID=2052148 RepID=A0A7C0VB33_UNCW3|nr:HD domain-containing protein [candidate division WOR-3 bacterium]
MEQLIEGVLRRYRGPGDIGENELEEVSNSIENFLEYSRRKDRPPIERAVEIGRLLRNIGAPVEGYKLMMADAEYYREIGDTRLYWNRLYFAQAFMALGYPTERMEKKLNEYINVLRRNKKYVYFLPLFLNVKGNILHIYREKYEEAEEVYKEALETIQTFDESFYSEFTMRDYHWSLRLIVNNYVDMLLKIERNQEQEKKLDFLRGLLEEEEKELPYINLLSLINKAEIEISRKNLEVAERYLKEAVIKMDRELERFFLPAVNRLYGQIWSIKGDIDKAVEYTIDSFGNSAYYGNSLTETESLEAILNIFRRLSDEVQGEDRFEFFKKRGLIDAFLNILSYKDWVLGAEHSADVAQFSRLISEHLNFSKETKKSIGFAAMLHDVGKIMIPWYTLNKPAPPDEIDWDLIQAHVYEGYRIVKKLGFDREAEWVLEHHERCDGSGYPFGKKNPSLESQVIAISDTFDAAISHGRRYRLPKTAEEVLEEIEADNGKFYPEVIEALRKALPSM